MRADKGQGISSDFVVLAREFKLGLFAVIAPFFSNSLELDLKDR